MSSKEYTEPDNSKLEEVTALKELIAVIVDYYCFKNNDSAYEDDEDNDMFSKNNDYENQEVIPNEIDDLIIKSFKSQLKQFIK